MHRRPGRPFSTGLGAAVLALSLVACSSDAPAEAEAEAETSDPTRFATDDTAELLRAEPGDLDAEQDRDEIVEHLEQQMEDGVEGDDLFHSLLDRAAADFRPYQEYLDTFEADFTDAGERPDGSPEDGEVAEEEAVGLNVQVLFDASSSMRQRVGGERKIDLAKEAVRDFVGRLPDDAAVSLRAYGHTGSNKEADKERSCSTTEAVYPLDAYDEGRFDTALDSFGPTGFTPIALALEEAREELTATDSSTDTLVYVVSDGEETCGGDPAAEAEALVDTDAKAVVNIIGFDVKDAEQKALKDVAEAGNGTYTHASSGDELRRIMREQREELMKQWRDWAEETRETARAERDAMQQQTRDLRDQGQTLSEDEEEALTAIATALESTGEDTGLTQRITQRGRKIRSHLYPSFTQISAQVFIEGAQRSSRAYLEGARKRAEIWQESVKGR